MRYKSNLLSNSSNRKHLSHDSQIDLYVIYHYSVTIERTFSMMNFINNRLKIKTDDEFLVDCVVLHIEKEHAIIIDMWL